MAQDVRIASQLNITLPNSPGNLARLSDTLRAVKVNINAICCTEGRDQTTVHTIVDDIDTAKIVLKDHGNVSTEEVLAFSMDNKPGAIFDISRVCAGAGVNIRNIYATTHGAGKGATVYVVVDNVEKALKAFSA
jgi:hypothetical protein